MLRLKKSLGQTFLVDKNVINKIVSLDVIKDKKIFEIGPGSGNLTNYIIQKKPKTILLIEKDKRFYEILSKKYRFKKNYNLGYDLLESIKLSHLTVGQAVLTTSITIALGFSVLCLSNFIPTILFGLFTSIAMIVAMLGVLITLPILLQLSYKKI